MDIPVTFVGLFSFVFTRFRPGRSRLLSPLPWEIPNAPFRRWLGAERQNGVTWACAVQQPKTYIVIISLSISHLISRQISLISVKIV